MTKRIFALLLALALCLSLFGCKPKNGEEPTGPSATSAGETNAAGDATDTGSTGSTDGADASEESKSDYENWGAGEVGL